VAGVLIGPHFPGPSITSHVDDLRHFTELGVVLLLFVIGLEMHPRRLWEMRRTLFGLGSAQILVTAAVLTLYFRPSLDNWPVALLMGLALALSSTALVMQTLYEQQEVATRHGQMAFSILLMQDLAVVPMIAFLPLFAGAGPVAERGRLIQALPAGGGMLAVVVLAGRVLVPRVLDCIMPPTWRRVTSSATRARTVATWRCVRPPPATSALGAFLRRTRLDELAEVVEALTLMAGDPADPLPPRLFFESVEQAPVAISVTDAKANILYANAAFEALTGYDRAEVLGKNESILSSNATPESIYQQLWRTIQRKRPWTGTLINRRKGGADYLAELTISPVLDAAGRIRYFLGMHRDVTREHELTVALRQQKTRIETVLDAADQKSRGSLQ